MGQLPKFNKENEDLNQWLVYDFDATQPNSLLKLVLIISWSMSTKSSLKTLLKCFALDALCSKAKHLKYPKTCLKTKFFLEIIQLHVPMFFSIKIPLIKKKSGWLHGRLLCKSSIWFTEKHIFKIIIYFLIHQNAPQIMS